MARIARISLIRAFVAASCSFMDIVYREESYRIVGICMDVHNHLGAGFLEVVYKDALEIEFQRAGISYEREKQYSVQYKGVTLQHHFFADFVLLDSIILEVKGMAGLANEHIAQALNYLKVSGNRLALLVNFGEQKLNYRRIVL